MPGTRNGNINDNKFSSLRLGFKRAFVHLLVHMSITFWTRYCPGYEHCVWLASLGIYRILGTVCKWFPGENLGRQTWVKVKMTGWGQERSRCSYVLASKAPPGLPGRAGANPIELSWRGKEVRPLYANVTWSLVAQCPWRGQELQGRQVFAAWDNAQQRTWLWSCSYPYLQELGDGRKSVRIQHPLLGYTGNKDPFMLSGSW